MGAYESGESFLAGVLAKLPEAQRAQVQAVFGSAEARDAISVIGDGVLARSDYSKQSDALKAQREELDQQIATARDAYDRNITWFREREGALKEYDEIKPKYEALVKNGGNGNGNGDGNHPPVAGLDAAAARKLISEHIDSVGPDFIGAAGWLAAKAVEHSRLFDEVLPIHEMLADPKLGKPIPNQPGRVYSMQDVYQARYGDRLAEKAKAAEDARIEKLVQEKLQAERAQAGPMPFPLRTEASVLDTIGKTPDASAFSVAASVDHYNRLQAERGA